MQTGLEYYWASTAKKLKRLTTIGPKNGRPAHGPVGLSWTVKTSLWVNWTKFIFMTIIFVILPVPRHTPHQIPGHLLSSRLIYYDKYNGKYCRHNLVTNMKMSLRLLTIGSVSHRRGIMTHLLWHQPYRHCCVIEGVQWQEKDYNCHNQLVIEGLTSCSGIRCDCIVL